MLLFITSRYIYIYMFIYFCHTFIYQRIHRRLLIQFKKDMINLEILRKVAMDTRDSEMVINDEDNACRFVDPGKTKHLETHVTCMVSTCQGKVTGVLY